MEEDGIYSSTNRGDILTMQNLDESTNLAPQNDDLAMSPELGQQFLKRSNRVQNAPFESKYGATLGRNLKEENEFAGELHFGTENKKWAVRNDDIPEIDDENALKYATFNKNTNKEKLNVLHSNPNPESIDVFNHSSDIKDKMDVKTAAHDSQAVGDRRILAYGQDSQQNRYNRTDDTVRVSNDMTMMSAKLDMTAITLKKKSKNLGQGSELKNTDVDDLGRVDTEDNELDIGEIHKLHKVNQAKNN